MKIKSINNQLLETMKLVDILFEGFLKNKHVYILNQYYWEKLANKILPPEKVKQKYWHNNQFANGAKIYDGNPIFSIVLASGKAIRIIQENPESDVPEIAAWVQETEYKKNTLLKELVISLELSRKTKDLAIELIKDWADHNVTQSKMEMLIDATLNKRGTPANT